MKKSIATIIILIILLAALTGCDAILEVFYPEFADAENSIEVNISVSEAQKDYPVYAEIWANWSDGDLADTYRYKWADWDDDAQGYRVRFVFDVPDGEYQIHVWLDMNENGWGDYDEPSAMATRTYTDGTWEWTNENIWVPDDFDSNYVVVDDIDFAGLAGKSAEIAAFWSDYRVLNTSALPGTVTVELNCSPDNPMTYIDVVLLDASENWVGGFTSGESILSSFESLNFNGNLFSTTGRWRYDVYVQYEDGTESFNSYPVEVVGSDERNYSDNWFVGSVSAVGLDTTTDIPYQETCDVILVIGGTQFIFEGAFSSGQIYIDGTWTPKDWMQPINEMAQYYYGSTVPSDSYIDVILDINENGSADEGEWGARVPVGLDTSTDYADFNLMPRSFVPY